MVLLSCYLEDFMRGICASAVLVFLFAASSVFCWDPSTKIAVLGIDSRVKGEDIDPASLSELIQNELVNRKAYIVVERSQLSKILDEQKLQASGIAENDATRIGSIAGANKVITGSLFKLEKEYQLLIKVIDVASGTIEIYQEIKGNTIQEITDGIPSAVYSIIKKSKGENAEEESGTPVQENEVKKPPPKGFFPIQLSFVKGLALIPSSFTIGGAAIDIISGYNTRVYGFQTGFINENDFILGFQAGFISTSHETMFGFQTSFLNHADGTMIGAQFGFLNIAGDVKGIQVGFINIARNLHGVQIGLVNVVKEGWIGFMPIINIGF